MNAHEDLVNPFTSYIMDQLPDSGIKAFIERWDHLESLVIRVYRTGSVAYPSDENDFQALKAWLIENYPIWLPDLDQHWRRAQINGKPALEDPFLSLLEVKGVEGFIECWKCMQNLPVAREALNSHLLSLLEN